MEMFFHRSCTDFDVDDLLPAQACAASEAALVAIIAAGRLPA